MTRPGLRTAALVLLLTALAAGVTADGGRIVPIAHGERVEIEQHLPQGRYALVDFSAEWCGPCRALEPRLEALASAHGTELAVLQIDIVSWDSPVARQFGIRAVPHLKLFDPEGRLVVEGGAARVLAELESRLGPGRSPPAVAASGRHGVVALAAVVLVLAVAAGLVLAGRARRVPGPVERQAPARRSDPGRIWFAMVQGSLSGPFTVEELEGLVRRSVLSGSASVRRRGDSSWTRLSELVARDG